MNALPLIVSFYTKDTPYEWQAEALEKSCKEFDLAYDIEGVPSAGSWEANCAYKPICILKMLQKHQRPILWVDSDAVFVRAPAWIGAFEVDLSIRINHDLATDHPSKIISSTMFVSYNSSVVELISRWAKSCIDELLREGREVEMWDQQILTAVLKETTTPLTVGMLPLEYLKIFDHPADAEKCTNPIIIQNQASRIFKSWVNIRS